MGYSSIQLKSSPWKAIDNCTPLQMITPLFNGHYHPIKPQRIKSFGCQAYDLKHDASKLDPTAKKMIFVGLEPGSNAYRLWDKSTRRIIVSADVKFDENSFPAAGHSLTPTNDQIIDLFPDMLANLPVNHIEPSTVIENNTKDPDDTLQIPIDNPLPLAPEA